MTAPERRCDDADTARKGRQDALSRGVEEPLLLQFLLQLLKRELQRSGADRLERFGDELKLAALFVDRDAATRQDVQRSLGTKAKKRRLPPEEHDGKLPLLILQREVQVSGGSAAQIGDFAFDPAVRDRFARRGHGFPQPAPQRSRCGAIPVAAQKGRAVLIWSADASSDSLRDLPYSESGCAKR